VVAGVAATIADFPAGSDRCRPKIRRRRPPSSQANLAVDLKGDPRSSWTLFPSSFRVGAPAVAGRRRAWEPVWVGNAPADQAKVAKPTWPWAPLSASVGQKAWVQKV
jgi:hypothetical protein